MHIWNINSISPFVDMRPLYRRISYLRACFPSPAFNPFFLLWCTCADVSNEMKVSEQEVFWLTILGVLKRPLADMLEVHRRIEREITDAEDPHTHAATSPFEVLTAFGFHSTVENPEIIIIYPNRSSRLPDEKQKFGRGVTVVFYSLQFLRKPQTRTDEIEIEQCSMNINYNSSRRKSAKAYIVCLLNSHAIKAES